MSTNDEILFVLWIHFSLGRFVCDWILCVLNLRWKRVRWRVFGLPHIYFSFFFLLSLLLLCIFARRCRRCCLFLLCSICSALYTKRMTTNCVRAEYRVQHTHENNKIKIKVVPDVRLMRVYTQFRCRCSIFVVFRSFFFFYQIGIDVTWEDSAD